MLGLFRRDLKKPDHLIPELPDHSYIPALKDGYLERLFTMHENPVPVIVSFGPRGFMGYSVNEQISPSLGPVFYMKEGICCIYQGGTHAKKQFAGKGRNEVDHLISYYKDLKRSNGYAYPYKRMYFWCADFNFILYDRSVGDGGGALVVSCWGPMPVYYGLDSYGFCVITDDLYIIKKVCGASFKPVSQGTGILIPVSAEIEVESIKDNSLDTSGQKKESAGKATEENSSGRSSSSVTSPSRVESIKAKSSGGSSPKKTSGGEAVAPSPSEGSSSEKGSAEKRNAASPSGGRSSKKGRG